MHIAVVLSLLPLGIAIGWFGRGFRPATVEVVKEVVKEVIKEVPVEVVKIVERLVTPPEAPAIPAPSIVSHDEYRVERIIDDHPSFDIYIGPDGGEARRWWEYVSARREPGVMNFYQNGELRDTWSQRKQ